METQIITYESVNVENGEVSVEMDIIRGDSIRGFDTVVTEDGSWKTRFV